MRIVYLSFLSVAFTISLIGQNPLVQEMVNATNRDSLLCSVTRLQAFGTRFEYSATQDSAASYILREFNRWGLQAASDDYSFGTFVFWDADLVNKDSLWVVGNSNVVFFSSDGGSSWTTQYSPAGSTFYGIDFVTPPLGVAVGYYGVIIRTTNAGTTWDQVSSPTTSTLYSVAFADASVGITVGVTGTILRTTSGGASWSAVSSGTSRALRDTRFISSSTAIAVGDSGYVLKSTDGGSTWKKKPSGVASYLYSVCFIDAQNGFASGNASTIIKTTDGGETWSQSPFPNLPLGVLRGILFTDSQNGLLIEASSKIFKTSNGGQSWQIADSLISSAWGPFFYKLRGIPGQRILVTGSRSWILTSTNDGATWTDYINTLPPQCVHGSKNIVATIPGTVTPDQECVMVAHYDSYSSNPYVAAPGANDNATGTASVMEAARVMRNYQFRSTVKLVAVSAEELGMYGSEHYAYTAKREGRTIVGAVNGDMLGYPMGGDTLHIAVGTYLRRNRLLDSAVAFNQRYQIGLNLVQVIDSSGASDYAPFALAGYDALDLAEGTANEIWGGADPFYHTPSDSASKLNFGLVRRAAQLMLATIAELAGVTGRALSVDAPPNGIPKAFALYHNYPNPFNPSTTLRYGLPSRSRVRLMVYNILGQMVADLVNAEQEAGWKQIVWNAHVSSGLYFYRLEAVSVSNPSARFVDVKKMILLK